MTTSFWWTMLWQTTFAWCVAMGTATITFLCLKTLYTVKRKRVDELFFKCYNNNVKRGNQKMKMKKNANGTATIYNLRNEELNRNLRKLGHKVVTDKKKQASKNACRKG